MSNLNFSSLPSFLSQRCNDLEMASQTRQRRHRSLSFLGMDFQSDSSVGILDNSFFSDDLAESNQFSSLSQLYDLVVYEFLVQGMTSLRCSQTIESSLTAAFRGKGLAHHPEAVNIILLVNKLSVTFYKQLADQHNIRAETIIAQIGALGFQAQLINQVEKNKEELATGREAPSIAEVTFETPQPSLVATKIDEHFGRHENEVLGVSAQALTVRVRYDERKISPRRIAEVAWNSGLQVDLPEEDKEGSLRRLVRANRENFKAKMVLSLSLYPPIAFLIWILPNNSRLRGFMAEFQVWNGVPLYVFLMLGIATFYLFGIGGNILKCAFSSLRNGTANMDVLVVVGTVSAWSYGIALLFIGYSKWYEDEQYLEKISGHAQTFKTTAVLITIVMVGKWLEALYKEKTTEKLSQLADLKAKKAYLLLEKDPSRLSEATKSRHISTELLVKNDLVAVEAGETIPSDGIVILGRGSAKEDMITGERNLVRKEKGVRIYGGSMLVKGRVIIRLTAPAKEATFAKILSLIENSQSSRFTLQGYADDVSKYFVLVILVAAVATWVYWFIVSYNTARFSRIFKTWKLNAYERFQFAFDFGISTLVVACPCALGLAAPTAIMVGTSLAASFGILLKSADTIARIRKVKTVVFEKTGTLTSGQFTVTDIQKCFDDKQKNITQYQDESLLYEIAYLAEQNSQHHLARTICERIKEVLSSEIERLQESFSLGNFKQYASEGVTASIILKKREDVRMKVVMGNLRLLKRFNIIQKFSGTLDQITRLEDQGKTVVTLAVDKVPQLIFALEEKQLVKPEAKQVVAYLLKELNLQVALVSGDNRAVSDRVATEIGIPGSHVVHSASAATKKAVVAKFQKEAPVLYIGDHLVDSFVLAQADVSCSLNSGNDPSVGAADVVLMRDNLIDVWKAVMICRKTLRRIEINFMLALVYNIILIPVAMGAFFPFRVDPFFSAVAMALSSISVCLSSLQLRLYNPEARQLAFRSFFG